MTFKSLTHKLLKKMILIQVTQYHDLV